MNKTILHISHTDIRSDSRILKELHALESFNGFSRVAIGVQLDEGAVSSTQVLGCEIVIINLITKIFRFLPRIFRYGLNFAELTIILFFRGVFLKPQVVHCHDTLVLPAGFLVKLFTKCKLIYDAHELESNKNGQSPFLSRATLFIEKLCWHRIDLLVSVSDSINSWYCKNLGEKDHIVVLNSPEISSESMPFVNLSESRSYFHRVYDIPSYKPVFVYLGIFAKGRGIEVCLDAFADPSIGAHVVFVGYGALENTIESHSRRYSNIHIHKPVPHGQVVSLVKNADFGLCFVENVSLSDYYCLPNKLFEYCFSGIPVLASDFPEIKRVVDNYSLGVCCSPDPDSVRKAINSIVANGLHAISSDLKELSWQTQAEKLRLSYSVLLMH